MYPYHLGLEHEEHRVHARGPEDLAYEGH
jgi:hypothetical protein